MDLDKLKDDAAMRSEIAADEGIRSTPYKDTHGNWTGGIGHNLSAHGIPWSQIAAWLKTGIPDKTIKSWFGEDIQAAIQCCDHIFSGYAALPDEAQRILANMAFDLMYGLWDWPGLRRHIEAGDWKAASGDILQSRFAAQDPARCRRLAARMRTLA